MAHGRNRALILPDPDPRDRRATWRQTKEDLPVCGPAVTTPVPSAAPGSLTALPSLRRLASSWFRLWAPLLMGFLALAPINAALAVSVKDLPSAPPSEAVLDSADVLSRASRGEIEKQLEGFKAERVDARLITVPRLDYSLSLEQLGQELLQSWTPPTASASSGVTSQDPLLLVLVDAQTKAAAVVASEPLQRQLPPELLRSTARTTMAIPLREGNRYRQASLDGLTRLATVLRGGEDPGEPEVAAEAVVTTNIPTQEETERSNGFTWVVVLLVVGSVVPMLTWWVFSR